MDVHSKEQRSYNMSRIKGKDTKPEMKVRRWLWDNGYRYRLHRKDLPGKPDIVFPGKKKAVFVHGCFWHKHNCSLRDAIRDDPHNGFCAWLLLAQA